MRHAQNCQRPQEHRCCSKRVAALACAAVLLALSALLVALFVPGPPGPPGEVGPTGPTGSGGVPVTIVGDCTSPAEPDPPAFWLDFVDVLGSGDVRMADLIVTVANDTFVDPGSCIVVCNLSPVPRICPRAVAVGEVAVILPGGAPGDGTAEVFGGGHCPVQVCNTAAPSDVAATWTPGTQLTTTINWIRPE